MAQHWYFGGSLSAPGSAAPYTPATFKGSWDLTSSVDDRLFSPYTIGNSQSSSASETSATAPFRVCVVRGVSPTLAAQAISGDLDLILGLLESNAAADFYTKIYVYVTQGDSDLVRGVLLDYEETSGGGATEWPTTSMGTALQAAQALTLVNALAGDRIVVEFGYRSENVSTTSRTGSVRIGARGSDWVLNADLTVGSTSTTSLAGFIEFENAIALSATEPTNMTPELATTMPALPYNSGPINPVSSTYALWWKRTGDGSENGHLGTFAGVDAGGGNYVPIAQVRIASGATFPLVGTGYNADFQAYTIPIVAADVIYLEVYSTVLTNPPGRNLVVSAIGAPTVPANNSDDYLISEDNESNVPEAVLIDKTTGAITGFVDIVISENGVVADNGVFVFTDKAISGANEPYIYGTNLALITAVAGVTISQAAGGQGNVPVATDGTDVWLAQQRSDLAIIRVVQFTQAGAVVDTWDLPIPGGWTRVDSIAVARDGSVLYYTNFTANEPMKRWDLVADMAMSDFYTPALGFRLTDVFVLRDDSILFMEVDVAQNDRVLRYTAAGALLNTYTFADPFTAPTGTWFLDHIAQAQNDPMSFGAWFQQDNADDSGWKDYVFERVTVATGVVTDVLSQGTVLNNEDGILTPEIDADVSATYFGAPNSCPLVILGARAATPAPETDVYAIRRLRRAPHLSSEQLWQFFSYFQLDLQAGVGTSTGQGQDPQLMLRWSDDGGFTWSHEHWVSAGKIGEYSRRAIWRRLGRGRDRVFEVTMSDPVLWVLLDAYLQAEKGTS